MSHAMTRDDTIEQCAQICREVAGHGNATWVNAARQIEQRIRALKSTPASDQARGEAPTMLPEDEGERVSFNRSLRVYDGSPLRAIAAALTVWSKMAPQQGSYAQSCAIYANECAKAAALASPQAVEGEKAFLVELSLPKELQNKEFRDVFLEDRARTNLIMGLIRLREKRGLTQAQLAEKTGTTQSGVARAESQDYKAVSFTTFEECVDAATPPSQPVHTAVTEAMVEAACDAYEDAFEPNDGWLPSNRREAMQGALRAALSAAAQQKGGDAETITVISERATPAQEWRPIETAPKDGVSFIASSDGWITTACWNKPRNRFCCDAPGYPDYSSDEYPTHYLPMSALPPLPSPPAKEQE